MRTTTPGYRALHAAAPASRLPGAGLRVGRRLVGPRPWSAAALIVLVALTAGAVLLLVLVAAASTGPQSSLAGPAERPAAVGDDAVTLGRKERVRVIGRDGATVEEFARIDTGAFRSSIDEDLASELGLDLDDAETVTVKSSLGKEERPVVMVTLQIGDRLVPTRVTVTDRSELTSSVLVGRHDLDGFVVDVAETHLTELGETGSPSAVLRLFTTAPTPPDQGALLAGLAVGAAVVVVLRQVVGAATFGTFAPVLLGLTYLSTGLPLGLLLTGVVALLAVATEPVVRRLHLPRVARLAVLVGGVTLVIVATDALLGTEDAAVLGAAFPVVVLASLVERFWECREEEDLRSAVAGALVTIAVAAGVSLVLVLPLLHRAAEEDPVALVVGVTLLCMVVGRYRGLRASELVRFRAAAKSSW